MIDLNDPLIAAVIVLLLTAVGVLARHVARRDIQQQDGGCDVRP